MKNIKWFLYGILKTKIASTRQGRDMALNDFRRANTTEIKIFILNK